MVEGLVNMIIGVALAFIVLIVVINVYGNVDNSFSCTSITNANGTAACNTAKNQGWNNLSLIATLIIVPVILGIFGVFLYRNRQ